MQAGALQRERGSKAAAWRDYGVPAAVLMLVYTVWYAMVWPGPIGPDGYGVAFNIDQGTAGFTGKEAGWMLYALLTYGVSQRFEVMVIPLLALHALMFSRMIGWTALQGQWKVAAALLVLVACTPHVLTYAASAYPDSAFSLAYVAVLFEVWLALRRGRLSAFSLGYLALLIPLAIFFRANGIVLLLPLVYLCWRLGGGMRWALAAVVVAWVAVVQVGAAHHGLRGGQSAMRSLILFETVNFMQTRPMNLWQNQHMVTERTREVIHRYASQESLDRHFDRDYWDTLWHQNQDVIRFREMTREDRRVLRREFFTYNLWRNIPAFISSRVNILLASALAQGGIVGPMDAGHTLTDIPQARSTFNPLGLYRLKEAVVAGFDCSYAWRYLTWTPCIGLALLWLVGRRAYARRDAVDGLIVAMLAVQLVAITLLSTAAEYRYLLMFFYAPLLLVPMRGAQTRPAMVANV